MDYPLLQRKLSTHAGTCLRYHLVGSCGVRGCNKEHAAMNIPLNAVTDIVALLRPGVDAAVSRS